MSENNLHLTIAKTSNVERDVLNVMLCISRGNIVLKPLYQRRDDAWSRDKRRAFVGSVIAGLPSPNIIVVQNNDGRTFDCVDGLQRLSAIRAFVGNQFRVPDDTRLHPEFRGKLFREFSPEARFAFETRTLPFSEVVFHESLSDEEKNLWKIHTFAAINKGASPLSPIEIARALYMSPNLVRAEEILRGLPLQDIFGYTNANFCKRYGDLQLLCQIIGYFLHDGGMRQKGALFYEQTLGAIKQGAVREEDWTRLRLVIRFLSEMRFTGKVFQSEGSIASRPIRTVTKRTGLCLLVAALMRSGVDLDFNSKRLRSRLATVLISATNRRKNIFYTLCPLGNDLERNRILLHTRKAYARLLDACGEKRLAERVMDKDLEEQRARRRGEDIEAELKASWEWLGLSLGEQAAGDDAESAIDTSGELPIPYSGEIISPSEESATEPPLYVPFLPEGNSEEQETCCQEKPVGGEDAWDETHDFDD